MIQGNPTAPLDSGRRFIAANVLRWTWITAQLAFLFLVGIWIVETDDAGWLFPWAVGASALPAAVAMRVLRDRTWTRRLRPLGIILTNVILVLVLGELAVNGLARISDSPLLVHHDPEADEMFRRYCGRPGAPMVGTTYNSQGFLGEELREARRPGVRRIVTLGDSFGVGVVHHRDNFIRRLEGRLDAHEPTEILNLSVVCVGPREYLHIYRTIGRRFHPDEVAVFFFVGNDVSPRRLRPPPLHPLSFRLTHVVRRLWKVGHETEGLRLGFPGGSVPDETMPTLSLAEHRRVVQRRAKRCLAPTTRRMEEGSQDTFHWLTELGRETGGRMWVVLLPPEFLVNDDVWAIAIGNEPSRFDRGVLNRRLAGFLERVGIPFLDLHETFRDAEKQGRTYKPHDTHWNRRGNVIAADAIHAWRRSLNTP